MSDFMDFSDLDDGLVGVEKRQTAAEIRAAAHIANGGEQAFPCPSCKGTGQWVGGYNRSVVRACFKCGGKKVVGKRVIAAAKGKETKAANVVTRNASFDETHPNLRARMTAISSWNSFVAQLLEQLNERGTLSDRQIECATSSCDKADARKVEKTQERAKNGGSVDISKIEEMFNIARNNGLKKLKFRTKIIDISVAPSHGRNAGSLYVMHSGEYAGKITAGTFIPAFNAKPDTLALVCEIAQNPSQEARDYGIETGKCGCCGRELTDPDSIANGIGPICADNWGL